MQNKRILYKLTTRSRPEEAYTVIRSIIDLQENKEDFLIVVSVDEDDITHNKLIEQYSGVDVIFFIGHSLGKIGSINRDFEDIEEFYPDWDILVNVSDDTVFIKPGFDNVIREQYTDFNGVLHTPDGNRKDLLTMSIMSRDYYELDGYIYHPSYKNLWCDNEAQEVAQIRGKYKYLDVQLFEHRHWAYNKGKSDHQYYMQNQTFGEDRMNYEKRKAVNFGL